MPSDVALLASLLTATYTDLRWREVPDWISYTSIAIAVGFRSITAINETSTTALIDGAFGALLAIALGHVMLRAGQWGGGDSKMLAATGIFLGFRPLATHPFVSFLANLMIIGTAYGLMWTSVAVVRHRHELSRHLRTTFTPPVRHTTLLLALIAILVAGIGFLIQEPASIFLVLIAGLIPLTYVLIILARTIERACFTTRVPLGALTEGDWPAEPLPTAQRFPYLTKKDISLLRKTGHRSLLIKVGMPFLPAFLFAFLATLLFGNILLDALWYAAQLA